MHEKSMKKSVYDHCTLKLQSYLENEEGASKILAEEELVEASNEEAMAIILPEMEPSVVYEKLGDGHISKCR